MTVITYVPPVARGGAGVRGSGRECGSKRMLFWALFYFASIYLRIVVIWPIMRRDNGLRVRGFVFYFLRGFFVSLFDEMCAWKNKIVLLSLCFYV